MIKCTQLDKLQLNVQFYIAKLVYRRTHAANVNKADTFTTTLQQVFRHVNYAFKVTAINATIIWDLVSGVRMVLLLT